MAVLIIHERVLGKHKRLSSVPIKNGQVITSDSKRIAQINRELRKKCELQRQNDAEAAVAAESLFCI